jgi:hypothetical protein
MTLFTLPMARESAFLSCWKMRAPALRRAPTAAR